MNNARKRAQRGSTLLVGILALLLMTAAGLALMYLANTESRINANFRSSQQAYFAAEAGVQEFRDRISPGAANAITAPSTLPGSPGAVLYILNPAAAGGSTETVDPANSSNAYFDDTLCHMNYSGLGLADTGAGTPCASAPSVANWYTYVNSTSPFTGTGAALRYKWVRITLKANNSNAPIYVDGGGDPATYNSPVCWNGTNEVVMPAGYTSCGLGPGGPSGMTPVYVVTAYAKGSRRMTQADMAPLAPFIPNAAVDSQDHVDLSGQLNVSGYDYCSCDCSTSKVKGKTVMSCTDRPGTTCDRSRYAIYSSSSVDAPNSSEYLWAGTGSPSGSQPIAQNQVWPYSVSSLIQSYKSMPGVVNVLNAPYNYSCTGTPSSCGSHSGQQFGVPPFFPPNPPANPAGPANMASQITYVPGDLQITGGSSGNGILLVDGNLDIHGGIQFNGLIIVAGVISFTGGGSNAVNIYGGILAGQQSLVDNVLGGGANVQYDYCSLSNAAGQRPPVIISARELN